MLWVYKKGKSQITSFQRVIVKDQFSITLKLAMTDYSEAENNETQ